jgi:hypothetical protein
MEFLFHKTFCNIAMTASNTQFGESVISLWRDGWGNVGDGVEDEGMSYGLSRQWVLPIIHRQKMLEGV